MRMMQDPKVEASEWTDAFGLAEEDIKHDKERARVKFNGRRTYFQEITQRGKNEHVKGHRQLNKTRISMQVRFTRRRIGLSNMHVVPRSLVPFNRLAEPG